MVSDASFDVARALKKVTLLLPLLGIALPVKAQYIGPPAELIVLGEWHYGYAQVPSDLKGVATDGPQRAFGVAFPLRITQAWQLRFRYDDSLFSGSQLFDSGLSHASAKTSVKLRQLSLDTVYSPKGDRWNMRGPYIYMGVGAGISQTWHERLNMGFVRMPGLPPEAEEQTWAPMGRVFFGVQLFRSVALEAQFQGSTHRFEGVRFTDAYATLGLRIWPAMLFTRDATVRPD